MFTMKWKYMRRYLFLGLLVASVYVSAQIPTQREEWLSLFNGQNLDGWTVKIHRHETGVNFGETFRVEDGLIKVRYDQYGDFNEQFAHLYYHQPYSYFRLQVDYHFTGQLQRGAPDYTLLNSGVMFHSQDPRSMPKEQNWPISVEMQFLAGLPDGKPRPTGNMCSPGTDIYYQGKPYPSHCLNSTSPTFPPDQWVSAELEVYGDSLIRHKINGETVLEYTQPTMGGGVVDRYDPQIWLPGQPLTSGFIALQSEGQPIDFKNVRLLNLEGCLDPQAKNYKAYFVKPAPHLCEY